jgi:hypothetical protein
MVRRANKCENSMAMTLKKAKYALFGTSAAEI